MEPDQKVMHAVNAVGDKLDERTARAHLAELVSTGVIDRHAAMLMLSAVSDNALRTAAVGDRDAVRASVFKQLLLVEMGRKRIMEEHICFVRTVEQMRRQLT